MASLVVESGDGDVAGAGRRPENLAGHGSTVVTLHLTVE